VSGSDDAAVTFSNVAPSIAVAKSANPSGVPSGGSVQYTVRIDNTSNIHDPVTINALSDSVFGGLNGQGTCSVPQTIQPSAQYSCAFTRAVTGPPGGSHNNTVSASGVDDENSAVSGQGSATVVIFTPTPTNTPTPLPTNTPTPQPTNTPTPQPTNTPTPQPIGVIKVPAQLQAPNNTPLEFFVTIAPGNTAGPITIEVLRDSILGDLDGSNSSCSVPQIIQPNGNYTCSFFLTVTGTPSNPHTNTVIASGLNNQGNPVFGSGSATVTIIPPPSPGIVGRAGDSPQDLIIITNAGARVRWVFDGQPGQAQSNPVSNPANYRQLYLPVIIKR
jgi:hypothetical protein